MKKKAKQGARLPKRSRARTDKSPPEKIGVSIGPASPKYANATRFDPTAYKKLKEERRANVAAGGESPPISSRHDAGPGLWSDIPLTGVPPEEEPTTMRFEVQIDYAKMLNSTGVCAGCLEKITEPKDHMWWCPWWSTEEGKKVSPF